MERNIDLIIKLMVSLEKNKDFDGRIEYQNYEPDFFGITNYSKEEIAYHLKLLIQSGYIEGDVNSGYSVPTIRTLTMAGHDFIDSTRDPKILEKAKSNIIKKGGAFTLAILQQILSELIKENLGIK